MRKFFKGMTALEFVLFLMNPIKHVQMYRRCLKIHARTMSDDDKETR